ncbi:MAG: DUF4332 domain-containing protein [Chloroflexi bacterium]|nr:MAG: DUF4332 domain-containing protein [Chloroflexota bacterium]
MYRTLEYLAGISDDDVRRLRSVGIRHTNQLLHRASLDIDRRRLAKKTGVSADRLLEFVNQCTLLEVSGLERWVPLIRRLGINSMPDLRAQDAVALHAKLLAVIGLAGAPTLSDVQYWISQATGLDIVEPPEPEKPLSVIR